MGPETVSLRKRKQIIRDLYTADPRPWIVAFSGGKDSTALLQLIWISLRELRRDQREKRIHVCFVDTGMEHPEYERTVKSTLRRVQSAAKLEDLPFAVRVLEPELKNRFFVCVIGRDYAPPTHWFRWCTRNLRIKPMSSFIRAEVSNAGSVVIALGLRSSESQSRSRILAKYGDGSANFTGEYGGLAGAVAFTPIQDFKKEHVWQFLMQSECPWGGSNRRLVQLYADASGECPSFSIDGSLSGACGGSRFGCWTCTVVRTDRSGSALAKRNESYEALLEFRNWLAAMRSVSENRWKERRNGKPGPGPLTIAARREALRRVMAIENQLNISLIRRDELTRIAELWESDGGNSSLPMTCAADKL
jgi:DNA sulfur modification protein DndC